MVNTSFTIQKEVHVTSNSELVPLIKIATLEHVHSVIRKLFTKSIPNVPLAERLAYFIAAWEKITQNQDILSIVKGYEIPFVSLPFQEKIPNLTKMSKEQFSLVEQEVLEMLEKGAIQKVVPKQGQFVSNLFLVVKKDGENRPVINFKNFKKFIPYEHFKMEGLHCLKFPFDQDDFQCKIDLKEAYFSVPLDKNSQKFVRFKVRLHIRVFLPLFWARASSMNFYKIINSRNCPLETCQHSNHYLSRRYVANGEDVTKNSHGNTHADFSIATFGFCGQPQKNQSCTL